MGSDADQNAVFETLFAASLEGAADCGGLLAYNYLSGEHITGLVEGRPLFTRTPDSQFNLAVLNENGLGVEQNMVAAYKWLSLAAKSGDKEAIRRRDILKGKLTAEQLAKADGLVATWRAKPQIPDVNDARKAGEAWKKNPENGSNG